MTPEQRAEVIARLDQLAAEVRGLNERLGRSEALLNGHMDARALDPGGHLQVSDWPEAKEPAPDPSIKVTP